MPIEFIGMIATREASEVRPPTGPVVDVEFTRSFARVHEQAGFDRVLIGYYSDAPDGFVVATDVLGHTDRLGVLLAHRPGFVSPTVAARKPRTGLASEHAAELGIDPERVAVDGHGAGAGLAAAPALRARDQQGPTIRFQLLNQPELDDRQETWSARHFTSTPFMTREKVTTSWGHYLGAALRRALAE